MHSLIRLRLFGFITSDNVEAVKLLLASGEITLSDQIYVNHTLLHTAAYHGAFKIIKFLVQEGVDINAQDDKGRTPLMVAYTLECPKTQTAGILLELGADPDIPDGEGMYPLHTMVDNDYEGAVVDLLKHKADVTLKARYGALGYLTPAEIGRYRGHTGCVNLIESHTSLDIKQPGED